MCSSNTLVVFNSGDYLKYQSSIQISPSESDRLTCEHDKTQNLECVVTVAGVHAEFCV